MSPAVAPVDTAQQSQEAVLLHSALMRISEDKREVLVLSRFQDLKYEEIAQLLGCEVGTVKTRVHRALQELRQIFHRTGKWETVPGQGASRDVADARECAMNCEAIGELSTGLSAGQAQA